MKYRCESCGYESAKWMGFCPQCRGESPLIEIGGPQPPRGSAPAAAIPLTVAADRRVMRSPIGIDEIDRVLGGGVVPGAALLLGGEPGVGKSTLLLQVAGAVAGRGGSVLVASAEESVGQVGLRAARLAITAEGVLLSAQRDVDAIIGTARSVRPDLLVVDSIQAVAVREIGGAPGGVAQVRESVARLVHFAKDSGVAVVLVGHVTKDGGIAGPKLVEHAVDVVLYLEGDPERGLWVLRGLKNRFGATHQVGLFEMRDRGLVEVTDPAGLLASSRLGEVAGSVVFPAVDGRRPLLVEVQALVASSNAPQPRRSVKGLEPARVHQIIAVLERHAELSFAGRDVYVSVVGGLKVRDPGVDLPVAIALASSLLGRPAGSLAAWGEVGLTGEVRAVAHGEHRTAEAKRLGLSTIIGPTGNGMDRIELALARAGLGVG
ncbi:MAG: DNA repair protein RadA [Acidimicrobiia bacterium]